MLVHLEDSSKLPTDRDVVITPDGYYYCGKDRYYLILGFDVDCLLGLEFGTSSEKGGTNMSKEVRAMCRAVCQEGSERNPEQLSFEGTTYFVEKGSNGNRNRGHI